MSFEIMHRAIDARSFPNWLWLSGVSASEIHKDGSIERFVVVEAGCTLLVEGSESNGKQETGFISISTWTILANLIPDITDPATQGCILEMIRRAWKAPRALVQIVEEDRYVVWDPDGKRPLSKSSSSCEIDALLDALEESPVTEKGSSL